SPSGHGLLRLPYHPRTSGKSQVPTRDSGWPPRKPRSRRHYHQGSSELPPRVVASFLRRLAWLPSQVGSSYGRFGFAAAKTDSHHFSCYGLLRVPHNLSTCCLDDGV